MNGELATSETKQTGIVRGMPDVPIGAVLHLAIEKGITPEGLEKLVALHERMAARSAAQEFAQSMAAFQSECPSIRKESTAQIATRSGGSYSYKFAELDTIARTIQPLMNKHGLSYTWDSTMNGGTLECTCTVRHVNGHSVTAKFACPTDSASAMSNQQKNAAALTYARRQSLIQVLGLTTCDPDTDGAGSAAGSKISESQAANIDHVIDEVGVDRVRFLAYFGVQSLEDIPASRFGEAMRLLEEKRKKLKDGGK